MTVFYLDSGGSATNGGTSDNNSAIATGTTNATILANKTFASATDVNTGTDVVTIVAHGFLTGMGMMLTTSNALPGGLTTTVLYFMRALTVDTLAFYLTAADAGADTNRIDITSIGTGTQTINNRTVQLGGTPNLSTVAATHGRVTTTGTSHVITFDFAHGITSGDAVYPASGTAPTGIAFTGVYWANALSSTTIRLYSTNAGALGGGAGINITNTNNACTYVCRDRAQQQCIYLNSATNTNRKTFRIHVADDTNDWVIVDSTVTGLGAGSTWAIGGRVAAGGVVDLFNGLSGLDTCILNTDISGAINATIRNPLNLLCYTKLVGKAGAKRVFTNTGNGTLVTSLTAQRHYCENIEFQSQGTGGALIQGAANTISWVAVDCRFTDSGTTALSSNVGTVLWEAYRCEFTGAVAAIAGNLNMMLYQCYFHDNTGTHVAQISNSNGVTAVGCIFERSSTDGVQLQGNGEVFGYFLDCTIYHNDGSGVNFSSNGNVVRFISMGSIWKDNGDTATEYNVMWPNSMTSVSRDNCYSISGGRGGSNVEDSSVQHSSDITSDPLFVDPDNGSAASRNFGLQAGSPARGKSFTFLGNSTVVNFDMGAAQPAASSGGLFGASASKRGGKQ